MGFIYCFLLRSSTYLLPLLFQCQQTYFPVSYFAPSVVNKESFSSQSCGPKREVAFSGVHHFPKIKSCLRAQPFLSALSHFQSLLTFHIKTSDKISLLSWAHKMQASSRHKCKPRSACTYGQPLPRKPDVSHSRTILPLRFSRVYLRLESRRCWPNGEIPPS